MATECSCVQMDGQNTPDDHDIQKISTAAGTAADEGGRFHDIYDRICKRCISLSGRATIMLINELYGKDYPLDSQVDYHWTEHTDNSLRRTLSDSIITIGHTDSYHIEFQMYPDSSIVMRVFEYGYHHAVMAQNGGDTLHFPAPMIVYLYQANKLPEQHELTIYFGDDPAPYVYRVPVYDYLEKTRDAVSRMKLVVLIPFQLLRLRKAIEKKRTPENLKALKDLIQNDIIEAVDDNIAAGNLTMRDGQTLKRLTWRLYEHIYRRYEEMEHEGVNEIVDDELILDIDILMAEADRRQEEAVAAAVAEAARRQEEAVAEVTRRQEEAVAEVTRRQEEAVAEAEATQSKLIAKLRSLGVSEEEIAELTR